MKKGKNTVAVGIPTFNNSDTIRETLESLEAQSHKPDRIIIVDASSDRTPEIVRSVAESSEVPIEYHEQSDRGRGVGGARQDIYELLVEDILVCLDTGQIVDDDWLEKRMDFHRNNPDYDALSSIRTGGDVCYGTENIKDPNFLVQSNCSITKSALDRVNGWDPWMERGEDWDFKIRLWKSGGQTCIKSGLQTKAVEPDSPIDHLRKTFNRATSVNFLRKYGLWYAKFHPIHILGELASLTSILTLVGTMFLALIWTLKAIILLVIPLSGVLIYMYIKLLSGNNKKVRDLELKHVYVGLRFFIIGYTMVAKVVNDKNHDWNYGGFNSGKKDN